MKVRHVSIVLLIGALIGCASLSPTRQPTASAGRVAAIESMIDEAFEEPVGGVVATVRFPDGETISTPTGYAKEGVPLHTDDSFRVASITKTYIATLVLSLVDAGLVELDQPIAGYLPALGIDDRITVRHLLSHSSGLPDHWALSQEPAEACAPCLWKPKDLIALIDLRHPTFEPGTHWSYTNTGYVILGLLIEAVTGNQLAAELRHRVLEPAGVENSFLFGFEPTRAEPVTGHWLGTDGVPKAYPFSYENLMSRAGAAGSLVSNAPDLLTFLDKLFAAQTIPSPMLGQMLDAVPRTPVGEDGFVRFGLGIHHPIEGDWWMHGGGVPGFQSVYLRDPETGATVIVLSNCSCADDDVSGFDVIDFGTQLMGYALDAPT
jgi:D-alanyl-D-alanine carboxypeptidase